MEIPQFGRSLTFTDDIPLPCLKATLPNSAIPKLAARHIEERLEDPAFEIFLLAKDPSKISSWQRGMLERLFQKGELAAAIENGMKEYRSERDEADFVDYERRGWEDVQRNGALPHVELSRVVIDDIQREVHVRFGTTIDGHLEEHGAGVYFKAGKWTFDIDYFYDYLSEAENGEYKVPPDFDEEEPERTPQQHPTSCDTGFLVGTWVFDAEAEKARLRAKGETDEEIGPWLAEFEHRRFQISGKRFLWWYRYGRLRKPDENEIVGCVREGKKVTLKIRELKATKVDSLVYEYKDDRLRSSNGGTFKRLTD